MKNINSYEDVDLALLEIGKAESIITQKEATLNAKIQKLRDAFEQDTAEPRGICELLKSKIETFLLNNKSDFSEKRSKDLVHGTVGLRTAPPKVSQLNKKYSVATSLELIKIIFTGKYTRLKKEINKEEVLSDYAAKTISDEQLASVGLKVDQGENPFYEIKWETLNKDSVKAA